MTFRNQIQRYKTINLVLQQGFSINRDQLQIHFQQVNFHTHFNFNQKKIYIWQWCLLDDIVSMKWAASHSEEDFHCLPSVSCSNYIATSQDLISRRSQPLLSKGLFAFCIDKIMKWSFSTDSLRTRWYNTDCSRNPNLNGDAVNLYATETVIDLSKR